MTDEQLKELKKQAKLELARREFFYFCHLMAPKFYKENRQYLIDLSNEMQSFYESDEEVLIINVPPRHGKSRTASMFAQWVFGQNIDEKIMTGSYNETLSTTFSKAVRNGISEEKADKEKIVYNDIFPNTRIKYGDSAMNLWSLEGGYNNYLATSPTGTATGFGATLLIIDDLIKNSQEAYNESTLEKHWEWFTNTMYSRVEEGGKIIIIMTRWSSKDLAGRALEFFQEEGKRVRHINLKALQDDGTMLCDEVLSRKSYESKIRAMSLEIAMANYQQEPIDAKGKLYSTLKTYEPGTQPTFKRIAAYTDTADTGSDYLATYIYGETMDNEAYILDTIYTKEPMEVTEELLAKKLVENKVNIVHIESNNGGRGYARAVERNLKEKFDWNKTKVNWFHQSANKIARILSASTWVMDHVYFPVGWNNKWPELYKALNSYQKEGKNAHDDAADALTGISEKIGSVIQVKTFKGGL